MKHVVVPARGPRASRIPVPLSSSLLKSRLRRRAARLETKRMHLPTQKRVCGVCATLPPSRFLSLSHSLPLACPVLDLSLPSPSLSVPLRLSPLSLLLCFCDLFVSASRVRFSSFFFLFLPPIFLRLLLRAEVVGLVPPCPPAHTNPQVHRSLRTLLLQANEQEREREKGEGGRERGREKEITAHRTCTRVPIFCQRHSRRKAARRLIGCVKRQGVRTHVPPPSFGQRGQTGA